MRFFRPSPPIAVPDADPTTALLVAEYESVRQESIASFGNAQSIIQWSLATYGVVFGAGIVALTSDVPSTLERVVGFIAVVIFAAILPGLICAATWQWLGEIGRMERVGAYLRGLEISLRTQPSGIPRPLGWESFLSSKIATNKSLWPYIGTALMYGGTVVVALVIAWNLQDNYFTSPHDQGWLAFWRTLNIVAFLAFAFVSVPLGVKTIVLGRRRLDFSSGKLVRF